MLTEEVDQEKIIWQMQPGAQRMFLKSPVYETLMEGTRGGGKTDALMMSFAQHCEKGFGHAWRGVLFRQTYKQLGDIIDRSGKWFNQIFSGRATYNQQNSSWKWASGETLLFRHMMKPSDYWFYHGHEYPWIGWEELTNWADDQCYKVMMSCCRSSTPDVPFMVRSTTNPYGPGHNWVKHRWRLPQMRNKVILDSVDEDGNEEPPRIAIFSDYRDNLKLMIADPGYMKRSVLTAARNKAERAAWQYGDWEITAGGMFDEAWIKSKRYCLLPSFAPALIPTTWKIIRGFDWGSSAPFSVGWYAISDGTDFVYPGKRVVYDKSHRPIGSEEEMITLHTVKGDYVRFKEWYGWNGKPNNGLRMLAADISAGIVQREIDWGIQPRVKRGPADSQIYNEENGLSYAKEMARPVKISGRQYPGALWLPANKKPGSRVPGWDKIRAMLLATIPQEGMREDPGLFITENCEQFLRTIPSLPRDENNPDDADTKVEDHVADEVRYVVYSRGKSLVTKPLRGR